MRDGESRSVPVCRRSTAKGWRMTREQYDDHDVYERG